MWAGTTPTVLAGGRCLPCPCHLLTRGTFTAPAAASRMAFRRASTTSAARKASANSAQRTASATPTEQVEVSERGRPCRFPRRSKEGPRYSSACASVNIPEPPTPRRERRARLLLFHVRKSGLGRGGCQDNQPPQQHALPHTRQSHPLGGGYSTLATVTCRRWYRTFSSLVWSIDLVWVL